MNPKLQRETAIAVLGAILLITAVTACRSPQRASSEPEVPLPEPDHAAAVLIDVRELQALQTAPSGGSGGTIGRSSPSPNRKPDGSIDWISITQVYHDIPAIRHLVKGPEDIDKFETLLILLRDVDFSVHYAAASAMKFSYGFDLPLRTPLTIEERLMLFDDAASWWGANRDRLEWNGERFIIPLKDK